MNRRHFNRQLAIITLGLTTKPILPLKASIKMNSQSRTIYKIINPSAGGLGKMGLKNIIQGNDQNYVSPFYLFDEFGPMQLPKGAPFRVDAHPHAGIIPTTYILKGNAHHRDSMGNDFEYNEGDFIQFTSGKGALHMEETGDELFKNGGVFQGFQGWLNIPSQYKKAEPYSTLVKAEEIKTLEINSTKIRVILGEVFGVKSTTQLLMPVIYWHVSMKSQATINLPIDTKQNAFIYLQNGQLEINDKHIIDVSQAVLFERDGDYLQIKAKADSEFLVLGGEVNNEVYVASGPFVLNNEQELAQAYSDFQNGKYGDVAKTNGIKR